VPDPENRLPPAPDSPPPDLEATRSIQQSEMEARLLHEALLDACRAPDGLPLADDDATRMVHVDPGDEDTTSLELVAVRLGEEETTTEDAPPALTDEVTPLTVAAPIDDASAVETGPTLEVAVAPDTLVDEPPAPRILPTARAPLVATRSRRSTPPGAGNPSPVAQPAVQRSWRRPRYLRRDVLVLVLLALIVVALFWAAATVPTGASPPPRPSAPSSGIDHGDGGWSGKRGAGSSGPGQRRVAIIASTLVAVPFGGPEPMAMIRCAGASQRNAVATLARSPSDDDST
jgi:hypothetical protein